MPLSHWGPVPVFVYESIVATRRWQLYALRFLFVLGLLTGLAMCWYMTGFMSQAARANGSGLTMRQLVLLAQTRVCPAVPTWFMAINPFVLAWAPYA
jgi:hypothetical protein